MLCLSVFELHSRWVPLNFLRHSYMPFIQLSVKIGADILNSFGEIIFEKLETLQTMYGLINAVFAIKQFRSSRWLLFPLLLLAKS